MYHTRTHTCAVEPALTPLQVRVSLCEHEPGEREGEKKDDPRSGVTSKRATADDLEMERAYPMCVSGGGGGGTWLGLLFTLLIACHKSSLQLDGV